jgi:hypothetical protein
MDDGPISEYLNRLGNKMLEARPDARGETTYDFEFSQYVTRYSMRLRFLVVLLDFTPV